MKIALAQLDVKAGHPKQNIARMLEMIQEAKNKGMELIAFPEMAIGGYLVGDKWTDDQYCRNLAEYDEILRLAADGIIIVYGNVCFVDEPFRYKGFDGRIPRYNAVYVVQKQRIAHMRFKTLLPNYRVFDDKRYFLSANDKGMKFENETPITLDNGVKLGLEICEDMWWEDYGINVTQKLVDNGADLIINVSSSPWTPGKNQARDNRINNMKKILSDKFVPFYYVNACGIQNNGKNIITFDGDSRIYNKNAEKLPHKGLKPYMEGIIYTEDWDLDSKNWPMSSLDPRSPEDYAIEEKFNAIIRAYKGIDEMLGWKPNYMFGLSGGIDSSLTATLAVLALGKERIFGFNLPSKYNSEKTKNAAAELAAKLGIKYETIPIQMIMDATRVSLNPYGTMSQLNEENIQAKIRGTSILSNLAAMNNGVMTNNGNKLEIALGYATLYGDVNGVFAPIGDLTKVEVFQMVKFINKKYGPTIPENLVPDEDFNFGDGIAPSAELKDNQLDPMKWGYHDRMLELLLEYRKHSPEDFMRWYINGELCEKMGIKESLFTKYHLNNPNVFTDDLEWFVKTIQNNVYKRVQSPPIVLLSKTAYGYDLRESQFAWESSLEYDRLKAKILGGI